MKNVLLHFTSTIAVLARPLSLKDTQTQLKQLYVKQGMYWLTRLKSPVNLLLQPLLDTSVVLVPRVWFVALFPVLASGSGSFSPLGLY